jgi:hypothetical protein
VTAAAAAFRDLAGGDPKYGLAARQGAAAATWPGAEAMGARPVADSVPGIVWAATVPDDGPRGGFFRDGSPQPW